LRFSSFVAAFQVKLVKLIPSHLQNIDKKQSVTVTAMKSAKESGPFAKRSASNLGISHFFDLWLNCNNRIATNYAFSALPSLPSAKRGMSMMTSAAQAGSTLSGAARLPCDGGGRPSFWVLSGGGTGMAPSKSSDIA
jgi:hypothetical protein